VSAKIRIVPLPRPVRALTTVSGLLVTLVAAVPTVARMTESGRDAPLPQLAAFTTWALPLWVLAGVLLLIGRRRRTAGLVLVVFALVIAVSVRWQLPPDAARDAARPASAPGVPLRVMTQNVEFGRGNASQVYALVQKYRVDVLVIEELSPAFLKRLRAAGIDGPLGYSDLHPHDTGAGGTGIWSRTPLTPSRLLPSQGFAMPVVDLTLPGSKTVALTGIHTRAPHEGRTDLWRKDLAMLTQVHAAERGRPQPQIYTGDFNASRDHAEFRSLLATGLVDAGDAGSAAPWPGFTWPADRPGPAATRIDHVLVTPGTIGVQKLVIVNVDDTDHHGVVADLLIR
jgi:endonuclease/exonuclease/phosphatase (EEP) superfamily protein YafD